MGIIGQSVTRVDAPDKVTGRAKYTDDIADKSALIAKVLHSSIAHGYVKSIDISEAERIKGVVKIVTCFDVPDIPFPTAGVVPKMQSLPQHAKNLLNAFGVGSISYRSQCLLIEQAGDGNGATNYVPDWVDMFAKDWFVLGGE